MVWRSEKIKTKNSTAGEEVHTKNNKTEVLLKCFCFILNRTILAVELCVKVQRKVRYGLKCLHFNTSTALLSIKQKYSNPHSFCSLCETSLSVSFRERKYSLRLLGCLQTVIIVVKLLPGLFRVLLTINRMLVSACET